jgi:hypothetical protein
MADMHFSHEQWADFARGVVDPEIKVAMDRHLAEGCARCARTVELLTALHRFAIAEPGYVPPPEAVRIAHAAFSVQPPPQSDAGRIPARLLYDSLREPLPAGMRAQDLSARQALYQAGDYYLDLRVEREPGSALASLVGQVVNRKNPEASTAGLPVILSRRRTVVARAISDRFGEFQMQYAPASGLRLMVPLDPEQRRIEVPLGRFVAPVTPTRGRQLPLLRRLGSKSRKA